MIDLVRAGTTADLVVWILSLLAQLLLAAAATMRWVRDQEDRAGQTVGILAVWGLAVAPAMALGALWSLVAGKYNGDFAAYVRWDHSYLAIVYPQVSLLVLLNFLVLLVVGAVGALTALVNLSQSQQTWYWQTMLAFVTSLPAQWFALLYSMVDG